MSRSQRIARLRKTWIPEDEDNGQDEQDADQLESQLAGASESDGDEEIELDENDEVKLGKKGEVERSEDERME
jgi:hypothetical protein